MQHVDEGVLHAYLDGAMEALADAGALPRGVTAADVQAHLRSCTDCRALLERERAVRGDAGVILQAASLDEVDVPPFPFEGARPPRRRSGGLPAAWAASVLLALGAGWWGSAVLREEPPAVAAVEATGDGAPDAGPAQAAVTGPGAGRVEVAAPERPGASVGAPPAREMALAADEPPPAPADDIAEPGQPGEPRIRAGLTLVAGGLPPAPRTDVVQLTSQRRLTGPPATASQAATAPADEAPGVPVTPPSTLGFSTLPSPRLPGRQSALQGGALPGLAPGGGLGRPAATTRPDAAETRATLPLDTFRDLVSAARAGSLEWQPATPRGPGVAPLLLLEGAEVELLEAATATGGARLVRVRQVMPDGVAIEMMQWQGAAAEVGRNQPGTGVAATVVASGSAPQGGREILLRAPALGTYLLLSADLDARRLAALADALVVMP